MPELLVSIPLQIANNEGTIIVNTKTLWPELTATTSEERQIVA